MQYAYEEPKGPVHSAEFTISVDVPVTPDSNRQFKETASSKKDAKLKAAVAVMEYLQRSGVYETRMAEITQKRSERNAKLSKIRVRINFCNLQV